MDFYEFIDTLTFLAPAASFTGVAAGIYYYRFLNPVYKMIGLYLIIALATDIFSRLYVLNYDNNLVFILIFSLLELLIFVCLYLIFFLQQQRKLMLIVASAGVLFIIWEIFSLRFIQVEQFQSYSKVVDTFLIILLSIAFFFEKIKAYDSKQWKLFRLNSIILTFFSLNLIFFLPLNFMINENSGLKFYFWLANLIITILFYIFLTLEIWRNGLTRKRLRSGSSL